MSVTVHKRFLEIVRREMLRMAAQPVYLFSMIIAPIFCFVFFSTLMDKGFLLHDADGFRFAAGYARWRGRRRPDHHFAPTDP